MAVLRHVMDGRSIEVGAAADPAFQLVQLCAGRTGKSLTDDELGLTAGRTRELALLYPGFMG
jgi:hypothetical protein